VLVVVSFVWLVLVLSWLLTLRADVACGYGTKFKSKKAEEPNTKAK